MAGVMNLKWHKSNSTVSPDCLTWTRRSPRCCAGRCVEFTFRIPVRMDDGTLKVFTGLPRPA